MMLPKMITTEKTIMVRITMTKKMGKRARNRKKKKSLIRTMKQMKTTKRIRLTNLSGSEKSSSKQILGQGGGQARPSLMLRKITRSRKTYPALDPRWKVTILL